EAAVQQMMVVVGTLPPEQRKALVPALMQALDDPSPAVSFTAAALLRKITGNPWHASSLASEADKRALMAKWKSWWGKARPTWPPAPALANVPPIQPTRADPAPDFSLTDLDGHPVRLADQRGHLTLLNFWGSWCPPCQAEIPALVQLDREYRSRKL